MLSLFEEECVAAADATATRQIAHSVVESTSELAEHALAVLAV